MFSQSYYHSQLQPVSSSLARKKLLFTCLQSTIDFFPDSGALRRKMWGKKAQTGTLVHVSWRAGVFSPSPFFPSLCADRQTDRPYVGKH